VSANFETDLTSVLNADTTLSALLGGRVYQDVLPENSAFPALVFKRITGPGEECHDGASGLERPLIQFDGYSPSSSERWEIRDALCDIFQPLTFKQTVGSTNFLSAIKLSDSGSYETETRLFRAMVEFEIWYQS
jgi:uncharacterized protein DUF3168